MANPQRENGHIDIANELVEALAKTQLSGHESRVLWALWRKTWGWVKKNKKGKIIRDDKGQPLKLKGAVISSTCWEDLTGLDKYRVSRTLRELKLRRIVTKFGNKNRWGFQKDYDQWLPPIQKIVTKDGDAYFVTKDGNTFREIGNEIREIGNEIFRKLIQDKGFLHAKETLKRNISKETTISRINFNYKTKRWENITEEDIKDWSIINPNCDVKIELEHMRQWLLDDRRREKKRYRKFIAGWIRRANKYGGKPKISVEESLKKLEEDYG